MIADEILKDKTLMNHPPIDNIFFSKRIREFEQRIQNYDSNILNMTFGYPVNLHADWMEEILINIDSTILKELNSKQLKKSINNYFTKIFNQENIFITTGASEALMIAIHACITDKNDEIILFDYGFYNYPEIIKSGKGSPVFAKRHPNRRPDIKSIEKCVNHKTKALLITQPENPLGFIFSQQEMEQLCLFCIKKNITLIVDHAFIESSYFGNNITLLTSLDYDKFLRDLSWIVIGDTGKVVCLYGIKYGCILASDNLKEMIDYWQHLILFQFDLTRMYVLSKILHDSRLDYYKVDLYQKMVVNLSLLQSKLDKRIRIFQPQATPMVLLDISHFLIDDFNFVEQILEEEKIALMPGCYFIQGDKEKTTYSMSHIRIAISRPTQEVEKAILKINRFILKLLPKTLLN